jgi:RimJ/RimL family protein N-acetyltransferase
MDERTAIINVKCSEPEGTIVRSVKLAALSKERMAFLWEKLKGFDTLFNDFVKDDYAAFVSHFILEYEGQPVPTGLLWDVDDVGIFFLNNIIPHQSASAHFTFWDQRFRGREQLCIEMLNYVFDSYKFQRIQVEVPLYAFHTHDLIEKLGFVQEGRLRKSILYHDKWFDIIIYSVLPADVGQPRASWSKRRTVCLECGEVFNKKKKENKEIKSNSKEISHV